MLEYAELIALHELACSLFAFLVRIASVISKQTILSIHAVLIEGNKLSSLFYITYYF